MARKNKVIDQIYDGLVERMQFHEAQKQSLQELVDDVRLDWLVEKAVAAAKPGDSVSSSLLQGTLQVDEEAAGRILDRLEADGFIGARHGDTPQRVRRGKAHDKAIARHRNRLERRRSFAVQQALLRSHQNRETLLKISELVKEEIVQILGAYLKEEWDLGHLTRRLGEEPRVVAAEIGARVGATVAGVLASESGWPDQFCSAYDRRTQVVLTVPEIQSIADAMHWHNFAASARRNLERDGRPGWDSLWLAGRLWNARCFLSGPEFIKRADPALSHVIVQRDGSVTRVDRDGTVTEFGPAAPDRQCKPLVTREHKGKTHEWIDERGWVKVSDPGGKERRS